MEKKSKLVYPAAICYSFITGLSFAFTKIALVSSDPINILGHRFLFAFIALFATLIVSGNLGYFNKENFIKIMPLGLIYPLLFFGFQTFGLQTVNSSMGGILLSMAPIFTLILSRIFLKEKPSKYQVGFVCLAVFGVIFIFYNAMSGTGAGSSSMVGITLLVITTLCFSTYSIMAKKFTDKYENLEILTVMITIGFIGFNILAFTMNLKNNTISDYFTPLTNVSYIFSIIYLGVLSTLGTSLLTNYILKYISSSKMSVFANLSTLISIVGGFLILKEEVFSYHIVGAVLIIVGVFGTNFYKGKNLKSIK